MNEAYVDLLVQRFWALELAKVRNPHFNVIDIWQEDGDVKAVVDNITPIKEAGATEIDGKLMYIGVEWIEQKGEK